MRSSRRACRDQPSSSPAIPRSIAARVRSGSTISPSSSRRATSKARSRSCGVAALSVAIRMALCARDSRCCSSLEKLLRRGDLEVVEIPDPEGLAVRHPWFIAATIPRGLYPGKSPVPPEPVRTVAVTALLVGRPDAPDPLVRETLAALYETDLRAACPALVTARAARDYDAAVMHPEVARYHNPSAGLERLVTAVYPLRRYEDALAHAANAGRRGAVKIAFDLRDERTR